MNESLIRDRIHAVLGEAPVPQSLASDVESRLRRPHRQTRPILGVLAAVMALSFVALITLPIVMRDYAAWRTGQRAAPATVVPSPHPSPSPTVQPVPEADLAAAGISAVAAEVTPVQLDAVDSGYTVTLIGAYAETDKTMIFLRISPEGGQPAVQMADAVGPLGGGSSLLRAPSGDYVYSLRGGPHPGPDGSAVLTIGIIALTTYPSQNGGAPTTTRGNWTWNITVPVHASTPITFRNAFQVGSWTVDTFTLDESATEIHLSAVIHGVSPGALQATSIRLLYPNGAVVPSTGFSASVTVPKQQLNGSNYENSLVNETWGLPPSGSGYQVQFTNGATVQNFPIVLTRGR